LGAAPPRPEKYQGKLCFQGKYKLRKYPGCKSIFNTVINSGQTLFFRASGTCAKIVDAQSIFNTVKSFRANSVFRASSKLLKNPKW